MYTITWVEDDFDVVVLLLAFPTPPMCKLELQSELVVLRVQVPV